MIREIPEEYIGYSMSPAAKNVARLTLQFTQSVAKNADQGTDNIAASPYNTLFAMTMAGLASDGDTRKEISKTLFGDENADLEAEACALSTLRDEILAANKGIVTLETASAFWMNKDLGLTLNPPYQKDLEFIFGTDVSNDSFADPATTDKINKWAADNTNNLIPEIVEEGSLTPDMVAILACSLYFKGDWTSQFDKSLTTEKEFNLDNGDVEYTETMYQNFDDEDGLAQYLEGKDFEALALTYGANEPENNKRPSVRFVIIKPKDKEQSAQDWLLSHDDSKLPVWMEPEAYMNGNGRLEMPHIDIKEKNDMIPTLADRGIRQAFEETSADFTRLTEEGARKDGSVPNIYISKVQQDIVFKADEEGSELAVVDQVGFALECAMPTTAYFNMVVDRSFVMMVQDVETGTPLALAAINRPNKAMKP